MDEFKKLIEMYGVTGSVEMITKAVWDCVPDAEKALGDKVGSLIKHAPEAFEGMGYTKKRSIKVSERVKLFLNAHGITKDYDKAIDDIRASMPTRVQEEQDNELMRYGKTYFEAKGIKPKVEEVDPSS